MWKFYYKKPFVNIFFKLLTQVVNARSDNNFMQTHLPIETFSRKGKRRYDKRVSTRSIFDLGSLSGIFDSRWCTFSQVCSSTQKIHPPEVSAHISNRLFVLENTRRFREMSRKYIHIVGCDSLYNLQLVYFLFFCGRFFQFYLLCILLSIDNILLFFLFVLNVIKKDKDGDLKRERIKLSHE